MTRPIYLDYHATTPVDPRVIDVLLPMLADNFAISVTDPLAAPVPARP